MQRARVISCRFVTPTVKWFRVRCLEESAVPFKAGQWADVYIPDSDMIGGYSMCSSPADLLANQTFDLAVKKSDHPPTTWMINSCNVGTEFSYRFGGNVYLDDGDGDSWSHLVLIGGGVGINPLYSILLDTRRGGSTKSASLLYSVATREEIQFKAELDRLAETDPRVSVSYFVTRSEDDSHASSADASTSTLKASRIAEKDTESCLAGQAPNQVKVFLCGPNPMMSAMEEMLLKRGVSKKQLHYEVWW